MRSNIVLLLAAYLLTVIGLNVKLAQIVSTALRTRQFAGMITRGRFAENVLIWCDVGIRHIGPICVEIELIKKNSVTCGFVIMFSVYMALFHRVQVV